MRRHGVGLDPRHRLDQSPFWHHRNKNTVIWIFRRTPSAEENLNHFILQYKAKAILSRHATPAERRETLVKLSHALNLRFRRTEDRVDLNEIIDTTREAEALGDGDSPSQYNILVMLADALSLRFPLTQDLGDLDECIVASQRALHLQTSEQALHTLSKYLLQRFYQTGNVEDLDKCVRHMQASLAHSNPSSRSPSLISLSQLLTLRFYKKNDIRDLALSISALRDALTCVSRAFRDQVLYMLFQTLNLRYNATKAVQDCDDAISCLREARTLCHPGPPGYLLYLSGLASALKERYSRTADLQDLDDQIEILRELQQTMFPKHQRQYLQGCLSLALRLRFDRTDNARDFEDSSAAQDEALSLAEEADPHPFVSTIDPQTTVALLFRRYLQHGVLRDLEKCIDTSNQIISTSCPPGRPERLTYLSLLSLALKFRFAITDNPRDLEQCMSCERELLAARGSSPAQSTLAQAFHSQSLHVRFDSSGDRSDLKNAISSLREALRGCPPDRPERRDLAAGLSRALTRLFRTDGNIEDLDTSVDLAREALRLCPPSQRESYNSLLWSLSDCLFERSQGTGDTGNLEESIQHLQTCLRYYEKYSSFFYTGLLRNLGDALSARFHYAKDVEDLDHCAALYREAVTLEDRSHSRYVTTRRRLGDALHARFTWRTGYTTIHDVDERRLPSVRSTTTAAFSPSHGVTPSGSISEGRHDLEESIRCYREAVNLAPGKLLRQLEALVGLAAALQDQFLLEKDPAVLDEAIMHHRTLLSLCSDSLVLRQRVLSELSGCLRIRSRLADSEGDLKESLACARNAVTGPQEMLNSVTCSWSLAAALVTDYHSTHNRSDLDEAMQRLHDILLTGRPPWFHLSALQLAYFWARVAHEEDHASAADAYKIALTLTEHGLLIPGSLKAQHDLLRHTELSLPLHAASHATEAGCVKDAIEVLERGRTMLWSEVRNLRTPIERLGPIDSSLRDAYIRTSRAIEVLGMSFGTDPQLPSDRFSSGPFFLSDPAGDMLARKRNLVARLDALTERIRQSSGFADFLRPPSYQTLREAAKEGPVLILNHSKYRSDIMIVLHDRPPVCVPLEDDFYEKAAMLSENFMRARQNLKGAPKQFEHTLRQTLQGLWPILGEPMVHALEKLGVKQGTRIWLCPTSVLAALPLHAAGPSSSGDADESPNAPLKSHKGKKLYLQDLYICSYTPSLSALIEARASLRSASSPQQDTSILVIAQHDKSLREAEAEVQVLRNLNRPQTNYLLGEQAKLAEVLERLQTHSWVHFACHGVLKPGAPFNSAFVLSGNDRLTLLDIIKNRAPNAELAFLSACHTAGQTKDSATEEALHLAAAMQFSGFRSVVGTMWQMRDEDGPKLAEDFYAEILAESDEKYPLEVGYKKAARALHAATTKMRKQRPEKRTREQRVTFEQWVNFVHIGA